MSEAKKDDFELNALLRGNVRYRLTFGDGILEFSAPYAKDRNALGELLEGVAKGLQDEGEKVVGECPDCMTFILEDEAHVCAR